MGKEHKETINAPGGHFGRGKVVHVSGKDADRIIADIQSKIGKGGGDRSSTSHVTFNGPVDARGGHFGNGDVTNHPKK